jgi:GAF domain-containing protein
MSLTDTLRISSTFDAAIQAAVAEVRASNPKFDWVGIYLLEGDILTIRDEHYTGLTTEHIRIPLTEGICGAAATARQTIVVDDVRNDPRYLACSIDVRSEIVVPVMAGGTLLGVLDLDSNTPAAFGPDEQVALEKVAAALGETWQRENG